MTSKTIIFRGLDLLSIIQNYIDGYYENMKYPIQTEQNKVNQSVIKKKEKGNNYYEFSPEIGLHHSYILYLPNEQNIYKQIPVELNSRTFNCMFCLKEQIDIGLGIPVGRTFVNGNVIWHYVEIFCSFNCVYAELKEKLKSYPEFFSDSLLLLSELFQNVTGLDFSHLKPSNDRRLLKKWNGYMDYNKYHENSGCHITIPSNYYFCPCIETLTKSN